MRKKIELFCINFMLYFYTTYVVIDWSVITKFGKIYWYPAWFIRAILLWIISPIFIVDYLYKKSNFYKEYQKFRKEMIAELNK